MTKPLVNIHLDDGLADVYAFATLYEYLVKNDFQADFQVVYANDKQHKAFVELARNLVGRKASDLDFLGRRSFLLDSSSSDFDLNLRGYSDLSSVLEPNELAIDLSILKNCARPTSEEQKNKLRKIYNLPLDEKILVFGFPSTSRHDDCLLAKVICELSSHVKMYAVGTTDFLGNLPKIVYSLIKNVRSHGVLKDYYAMSDVALINQNVGADPLAHATLHNFIEATAGGPLFLVKPNNVAQYGYKQLVQREVIRESEHTDDLIAKVKKYLQNPEEERVREQRTQHLEHSRELYLNDLMKLFNKLLRISDEPFESDLEFYSHNYFTSKNKFSVGSLIVIHPETNWFKDFSHGQNRPLKELNSKCLDDKCFKRGAE